MSAVNMEELKDLAGELLPERAVLSTLGLGGHGDGDSAAFALAGGHGGNDHHPTVVSTCTSSSYGGAVAGVLPPQVVQTCTPSTVA